MPTRGPLYCETPAAFDGFPAEPWNAYSSMVICVWGLVAWLVVLRRAPGAWPLLAMCALLVLNGVGSTLWHGLRTGWALTLDVQPALVFVALGAFLWAWRVGSLRQALMLVAALIVVPIAVRFLPLELPFGRIVLTALVVIAAAVWLIARTWPLSRTSGLTGLIALILALLALAFRSLDGLSCAHLAFGSHFLWHVTLSAAAFTLLLTLLRLEQLRQHR